MSSSKISTQPSVAPSHFFDNGPRQKQAKPTTWYRCEKLWLSNSFWVHLCISMSPKKASSTLRKFGTRKTGGMHHMHLVREYWQWENMEKNAVVNGNDVVDTSTHPETIQLKRTEIWWWYSWWHCLWKETVMIRLDLAPISCITILHSLRHKSQTNTIFFKPVSRKSILFYNESQIKPSSIRMKSNTGQNEFVTQPRRIPSHGMQILMIFWTHAGWVTLLS